MSSAMLQEHASMQTGNYQAIDKKVVYEFIIMTSNLTGIAVKNWWSHPTLLEPCSGNSKSNENNGQIQMELAKLSGYCTGISD